MTCPLQYFWFRHIFLLTPQQAEKCQQTVVSLMRDRKLEVQEMATNTLSGILPLLSIQGSVCFCHVDTCILDLSVWGEELSQVRVICTFEGGRGSRQRLPGQCAELPRFWRHVLPNKVRGGCTSHRGGIE